MKPRERVEIALSHREPDRCPLAVTFTPEFARRLAASLGLTASNSTTTDYDYVLEREVGCDLLLTAACRPDGYNYLQLPPTVGTYLDEWGIEWETGSCDTRNGTANYVRIVSHPLADAQALASFEPPDPLRPELYQNPTRTVERFKNDYFIVGVIPATVFETAWALRGLERLLVDMKLNPALAEKLLDIPLEYHLKVATRLVELGVDMVLLADDVGGEDRMLISPGMWRHYLKPRLAKLVAALKELNHRVKIAYHSDGAIYPILPDLIEVGVDVLHPVAPRSLNPEKIKREFGDKLSFWGTVELIDAPPLKKPAEIEAQVVRLIKSVGKDGGLIVGPTHPVEVSTPMENFWAMVNGVRQTFYHELKSME